MHEASASANWSMPLRPPSRVTPHYAGRRDGVNCMGYCVRMACACGPIHQGTRSAQAHPLPFGAHCSWKAPSREGGKGQLCGHHYVRLAVNMNAMAVGMPLPWECAWIPFGRLS
jgi:hypothetical protein